jgi:hypothetical protein
MSGNLYFLKMKHCKKCGKEFLPAPLHIYKTNSKYYCSWTCYNHRDDKPPTVPKDKGGNAYESYQN